MAKTDARSGLDKNAKAALKNSKQPMLIVRPASKMLGLDMLHVSLLVLVIILIGLAFALASFQKGVVIQSTNATHNASQVLSAAEQIVAGYQSSGGSIQLIPYYLLPNEANVTYIPAKGEWSVTVPYLDPTQNYSRNNISLLIYDKNLSLAQPFIQIFKPSGNYGHQSVAYGVVEDTATTDCQVGSTHSMYVFVDPYAPGALVGIENAISITQRYNGTLNTTYKIVFTNYAASKYANFGEGPTQKVGAYLACASKQHNFPQFISNFSQYFYGNPIGNNTLQSLEYSSGVNVTSFNICLGNSTSMLQGQALQLSYYNITTTPVFLLDCKYQTLPETVNSAMSYILNSTK